MMGCREVVAGQDFNLGDPLFQRVNKFRPLVPEPYTSPSHNFSNSSSCFNFISLNNNYHRDFGTKGEERKEESTQVMVSSRWNPTPEQLTALEELYRCGTRTPSAEQIQHITAQLRRYGKIEGKNVFYWFQNHKARERQKRRRHLQPPITSTNGTNAHHANDLRDLQEIETIGCKDDKEPGVAKTSFVVEQNFKWTPFISKDSNNPPIILQSEATGPRKAADDMISSECNAATAWIQFHDTITNTNSATTTSTPEFQHNYNSNNYNICTTTKDFMFSSEGNATWPSQVSTTSTNKTITPHQVSLSSNNLITSTNCCSHQDLNHSPKLDYYANDNINSNNNNNNNCCDEENGGEATKSLTLELFPLVKLDRAGENADVILRKMVNMKGNCCVQTREENFNYEFVPYYQFL